MDKLDRLECTQRFTGGYSQCRVYLALASFHGAAAARPWIVKLGPRNELEAEAAALTLAKAQVDPAHIASKIELFRSEQDDTAVLLLDFAHYNGRAPIELENAVARLEAVEAVTAVCDVLKTWTSAPIWKTSNVSSVVKTWTGPKLASLPAEIRATGDSPVVYSPDFGEAYSNPLYHLARDLKRTEIRVPFAFTHGDLNTRNVLFARQPDGSIARPSPRPIFVDFRHAGNDQYAIVDFAKLEACLRYQHLPATNDMAALYQRIAFLESTRRNIQVSSLPEVCTDKALQDLWKCIQPIRAAVAQIFAQAPHPRDAKLEAVYWGALLSYAVSTATYQQLPLDVRILAFLDGAALFSEHFQSRPIGNQRVLAAHPTYSPPVVSAPAPAASAAQLGLLVRAIVDKQAVLIVGPDYGQTGGAEPLTAFLQRLYKQVTGSEAPAVSTVVLLEALQRRKPRQDLLHAIRSRVSNWTDKNDRSFASLPWTSVVHGHFDAMPYHALAAEHGGEPLRIDSVASGLTAIDSITAGRQSYVPLYGDAEGLPDGLVLTGADRKERERAMGLVARGLEQRQRSLAIVFWKCDRLSIDEVAGIRSLIAGDMTVNVDTYYLSLQDDNTRDTSLVTLDIHRVAVDMSELISAVRAAPEPSLNQSAAVSTWARGNEKFRLPDLARYTGGLLKIFDGSISAIDPQRSSEAFLLGAAASRLDVIDGRVVRRAILDSGILPAIRNSLNERDREPKVTILRGRAGSGVSTLLCHAAVLLERDGVGPLIVADTSLLRGKKECILAGELLAEVARITSETVVLLAEATDRTLDGVLAIISGAVEKRGRLVAILGGRRDSLLNELPSGIQETYFQKVDINDRLARSEWVALARVLRRYDFGQASTIEDLAARMEDVGRLLPALYEATDKQNRKFREIIAHEFGMYRRDNLVQRAYRFICTMGAFDVQLSQYWLLKALGDRSVSDASRILNALSEDIVVQREDFPKTNDVLIRPIHRIIAEEVVHVATPDPNERLYDIERLIATANLASERQGLVVAALLYRNGPLTRWIRKEIASDARQEEVLRKLFGVAFDNGPLHPRVEVNLRQHFALLLRDWSQLDEALGHLKQASKIDSENLHTAHILGLVHERRAVVAWRNYLSSRDEQQLVRARSNETEALEFFRNVRDASPMKGHGYESEARYYRRKFEAFRAHDTRTELAEEARMQVFHGLYLLRTAEARVPRAELQNSTRTKAILLNLAGDVDTALKTLASERIATADPVRRLRLTRAALTLSMEVRRWSDALAYAEELFAAGERDAALFLTRDDCAREVGWPLKQRSEHFRSSAEEYNRWDVETLLRWAAMNLEEARYDRAVEALRRADEVARSDFSIMEREAVRGVLREKGKDKRFTGTIVRLMKRDEGFLSVKGLSRDLFFRAESSARSLEIGDSVECSIAWRIRGLRAIGISR